MIPAHVLHAEALAAIHEAAFPPAERWDAPAFAGQLGLPGVFGLIEEDGGLVMVRVAADEAEILTLAIAPSVRRRGLGTALLRAAMLQAGRRGAATMFLEVSATNRAALALYAGAGFQRIGARARYYADGTDALVLRVGVPVSPGWNHELCGPA